MPVVGDFKSDAEDLRPGDSVVVKTDRGTEIGYVLKAMTEMKEDSEDKTVGEFLRKVSNEDRRKALALKTENCPREFLYCQDKIQELNLAMKLVHVEHLFGGEKIVFYFLADGRVDFRQLVKDLAHEYHTRIEMRQIGVRDESRLKGDIEHCGQELCCRRYMKNFEPVTMKMAKSQKATLDPAKISGHCGRLMCCLRYENEVYNEFMRKLPRRGTRVVSKRGVGKVINIDILAQKVTIETDARVRLTLDVEEITGRDTEKPEPPRQDSQRQNNRGGGNNRKKNNKRNGETGK